MNTPDPSARPWTKEALVNIPIPAAADWPDCGNVQCKQSHIDLDWILTLLCKEFDKNLGAAEKHRLIYNAMTAVKRNAATADWIDELRADLASERDNILSMGSQIEEIRAELGKWRNRCSDLCNERDAFECQRNGLFEEIAALKSALKNALLHAESSPTQEARLRDELKCTLSREAGLRGQVENLGKEVCRLNKEHCVELNERTNQIEGLRAELLAHVRRGGELIGQVETLGNELATAKYQVGNIRDEMIDQGKHLGTTIGELENEMYQLRCEHDAEVKDLTRRLVCAEQDAAISTARSVSITPEFEESALRRFIHEDIEKAVREAIAATRYVEKIKRMCPLPGEPHWPEETDPEGPVDAR